MDELRKGKSEDRETRCSIHFNIGHKSQGDHNGFES